MATLEEHNKSMTIFYYKRTGEIKNACFGISDMSFYGDFREDYEMIVDFIVIERDSFVFERISDFKVDLDTKELVCKTTDLYKKHLL